MTAPTAVRRNIHTYPFKYRHNDADEFFSPELAAIYIHIPFCSTKCHFCDYVVYTNAARGKRSRYVDALIREIRAFSDLACFPRFKIDAVYIGGGTPGLLDAQQLIAILSACRETFEFVDACEVAVEFDPASVSESKLQALRRAGFNRLSIGVQSFDEQLLKQNNRPHGLDDIHRAMAAISSTGFTHNNVDLIYPLIGLSKELWQDSLDRAIELEPSCITVYPLEVWPDTAYDAWLRSHMKKLPGLEEEIEMCRMAFDTLEAAGYRRWSTSGYYHPDRCESYCRFLDYYWRTWPMLGFGVGSKSVIHDRLYTNVRSLAEFVERAESGRSTLDFSTRMTKQQEMRRVMIRGLKVCRVSRSAFVDRFGVPIEAVFAEEIEQLINAGWLVQDGDWLRLTREGQIMSRSVYSVFYTDDDLRDPVEGEVQFGISDPLPA